MSAIKRSVTPSLATERGFFMATSASAAGLTEDRAYLHHHFNCPQCCAAGLSGGKQLRCADGLRLWNLYLRAANALQRKE